MIGLNVVLATLKNSGFVARIWSPSSQAVFESKCVVVNVAVDKSVTTTAPPPDGFMVSIFKTTPVALFEINCVEMNIAVAA
jgi:hypothetical protein